MTKVVVVVKGGVVQEVLSDGEDVKVLVVDREPAAGKEYLLADVLGEPAALAALIQGAVTLNPQRTQQAFEETLQRTGGASAHQRTPKVARRARDFFWMQSRAKRRYGPRRDAGNDEEGRRLT